MPGNKIDIASSSSSVRPLPNVQERVFGFLGRHKVEILVGVVIVGGALLCLTGVGVGILAGGAGAAALAKVILISSGMSVMMLGGVYGAREGFCRAKMSRQTYYALACNKSNTQTKDHQQESLGSQYEGASGESRLRDREKAANDYIPEEGEKETVEDVRKLRKMLAEASSIGSFSTEVLVDRLEVHVERLSIGNAEDIIYDPLGRASFFLPGGASGHAIIYEFVRERDDSFSFVIYNTGEGLDYQDFHGKVDFFHAGKQYKRTRAQITGLRENQLKNRDFLKFLIESHKSSKGMDMNATYLGISEYLQDGQVKTNPLEGKWTELRELRKKQQLGESQKEELYPR